MGPFTLEKAFIKKLIEFRIYGFYFRPGEEEKSRWVKLRAFLAGTRIIILSPELFLVLLLFAESPPATLPHLT